MELISRPFNGRNYWKKKGYALLDGTTKRKNTQVVRIGNKGDKITTSKNRQFVWKLKRAPKVLVAITSPKRLWRKFSESYVKFTLRIAGKVGQFNGGAVQLDGMKKIERGNSRRSSKEKRLEEFETRLVLEIYKALSTSRGLSEAVV